VANEAKKKALLEAEITRLDKELGILQRQWDKKERLLLFGLAAIPVYFVWGGFGAFVVIACTPFLLLTQAYLLGVRRVECRQLIAEARKDIARLELGPDAHLAGDAPRSGT
jgi:hypothetical protein